MDLVQEHYGKEENYIVDALTRIFNESLQKGKLPTDWKKAIVVPIFKKDRRADLRITAQ